MSERIRRDRPWRYEPGRPISLRTGLLKVGTETRSPPARQREMGPDWGFGPSPLVIHG
jgi:hypothetical protein